MHIQLQLWTFASRFKQIGASPHPARHGLQQVPALLFARIVRLNRNRDATLQFRLYLSRIATEPGFQQVLGQLAGQGWIVLYRCLHSSLISAVSPALSKISFCVSPDIFLERPGQIADVLTEKPIMIHVTRLNHTPVVLNSDLIEQVETTPDTVISMTTGERIMVLESTEEIIDRIRLFRRSILAPEELFNGQSTVQKKA